jgi:hypothetical protein
MTKEYDVTISKLTNQYFEYQIEVFRNGLLVKREYSFTKWGARRIAKGIAKKDKNSQPSVTKYKITV